MAKDDSKKGQKPQAPHANNAALDAGPSECKFEDCKKKPRKFGFCDEHYEMYMAGIIKGDGSKPADYPEKLAWYLNKSKRAVA